MSKKKVLFVCIHNSARSQMAESFLKDFGKQRFDVYSAGLEPGSLNPIVVEVMSEIGYDISNNKTKSVIDFLSASSSFDYVITVCDEASAEKCPFFPGNAKRLHWGFSDPSGLRGNHDEKLEATRKIRDEIKSKITNWLEEVNG